MDREYYMVNNTELNESTPIMCDGYQIIDGWVVFYSGNMDFVVMSVPPKGFWFMQLNKEQYEAAEAEAAESGMNFDDEDLDVTTYEG